MKTFNELNVYNSTITEFEGREFRTTQDAYLCDNGEEYKAHALDEENNEYQIVWAITHPDFVNLEDESEACDWDNPSEVKPL